MKKNPRITKRSFKEDHLQLQKTKSKIFKTELPKAPCVCNCNQMHYKYTCLDQTPQKEWGPKSFFGLIQLKLSEVGKYKFT